VGWKKIEELVLEAMEQMYGPPGMWFFLSHSFYVLMTIRYWENPSRACMRCLRVDKSMLLETCWTFSFIGNGAKLVRDAFALAKKKAPAIIFINELDAIDTKRFDSDKSGDREVQRTVVD
jgi:hypothetical protein